MGAACIPMIDSRTAASAVSVLMQPCRDLPAWGSAKAFGDNSGRCRSLASIEALETDVGAPITSDPANTGALNGIGLEARRTRNENDFCGYPSGGAVVSEGVHCVANVLNVSRNERLLLARALHPRVLASALLRHPGGTQKNDRDDEQNVRRDEYCFPKRNYVLENHRSAEKCEPGRLQPLRADTPPFTAYVDDIGYFLRRAVDAHIRTRYGVSEFALHPLSELLPQALLKRFAHRRLVPRRLRMLRCESCDEEPFTIPYERVKKRSRLDSFREAQ